MRKQWHCKIGVGNQDALHYGFHEGGDRLRSLCKYSNSRVFGNVDCAGF